MTLEELDKASNEEVAIFLIETWPHVFKHCPEDKRLHWLSNHSELRNAARSIIHNEMKKEQVSLASHDIKDNINSTP